MKSRLLFYISLIAMPVIAFCLLGQHFLTVDAPRLVAAEKALITKFYRESAESMLDEPSKATWTGEREKGWRQVSKIARKYPWGFVPRGEEKVLVWIETEKGKVLGCELPEIQDDSSFWVYGMFGFSMGMVVFIFFGGLFLLIAYDREREAFLAGMIHDLRTPLVAIRGLAMRDPESVPGIAESMLAMVRNGQDFLGLGGRRKLEIVKFDVVPLIRESYDLFKDEFAEEESGPVKFDLPDRLEVSADIAAVRQILWNLFSNAVKYAAPYGPVAVRASVRGTSAAIEFVDQGIGMSWWQRYRVFGRFYRAANLHVCGKGGFGIGLYTSRSSARRLGGDLAVRANSPKGSVFTLTLKI